jgi:hypothetical protein
MVVLATGGGGVERRAPLAPGGRAAEGAAVRYYLATHPTSSQQLTRFVFARWPGGGDYWVIDYSSQGPRSDAPLRSRSRTTHHAHALVAGGNPLLVVCVPVARRRETPRRGL